MMLFLLKTFLTLLALLATCVLLPQFPLGVLRFVLRGVGWVIQKRTRSRREFLISRVRADEEEQLVKRSKSSPRGEDEDWEKVDSSSSSSGTAGPSKKGGNNGNKGPADADWEGIIGFFHPFW
jgi:alpha-1,2-mannosyltransferase